MYVEKVEVEIAPGFTENCYIVSAASDATRVIVVDPGAQATRILDAVGERIVDGIVLTHRHYDHTGALGDLVRATGAEVSACRLDAGIGPNSFIPQGGGARRAASALELVTREVAEGDLIAVGDGHLRVLYTPGHTVDSICLYDEAGSILMAGDTLFRGAVGRTDLPTGDVASQRESLRRLARLPDETHVYPGHDEDTSIGREKRYGYLGKR